MFLQKASTPKLMSSKNLCQRKSSEQRVYESTKRLTQSLNISLLNLVFEGSTRWKILNENLT